MARLALEPYLFSEHGSNHLLDLAVLTDWFSSTMRSVSNMRIRLQRWSCEVFLYALSLILTIVVGALPLQAEQDGPPSLPAPFQPDEVQHGFAQFDTVPEFPEASSDSPSSDPLSPRSSDTTDDQRPAGLFKRIVTAEGFELEEGLRRGHLVVPVNPTETFQADTRAIFVVFNVFKHYAPYQVIGRLFPERVEGLDPDTWIDEDAIYLATEDEGGYLKFFPPNGRWQPGTYRVDIYVGYEANQVNYMGRIPLTIVP
ncbi:MAG: hypothetical protein D6690_05450 [Nitrospirae bacterium]|nr:MAG: hypothetical protein D6690_05450 [Nitrospirota bacterium]